MASTSVVNRFKDKHYINWLKVGQALDCLAEGVLPFCKDVVETLHKQLLSDLGPIGQQKCSVGCKAGDIVFLKKPGHSGEKGWTIHCRDNICDKWLAKIVPLLATKQLAWGNSTISEWPVQYWQVAKIFMGSGKDATDANPTNTDALGLVQLMINCKEFHSKLDTQNAIEVRNVRNKLFHSDNLKVTDSALSDRIKVMVTLLEDKTTLFDDSAAQGAVHELNGIKAIALDIIAPDDELSKLKQAHEESASASKQDIYRESLRSYMENMERMLKILSNSNAYATTDGDLKNKVIMQFIKSHNDLEKRFNELTAKVKEVEDQVKRHETNIGELSRSASANKEAISKLNITSSEYKEKIQLVERLEKEIETMKGRLDGHDEHIQRLDENNGSLVIWQKSIRVTDEMVSVKEHLDSLVQKLKEQLEDLRSDDTLSKLLDGSTESDDEDFCEGDEVRIESSEERAKKLQDDHGGWNYKMKKYLGQVGVVKGSLGSNILVQFSDGDWWSYNKQLLQPYNRETDGYKQMCKSLTRCAVVTIDKDKEKAIRYQKGHGEWNPSMASDLGSRGIVRRVDGDGDARVECMNHNTWWFNSTLLEVIDTSDTSIEVGDFVLVIDSYKKVKDLQDVDHGGWNDNIRGTLGSAGSVLEVLPNECARVLISDHPWVYNTKALRHVARSELRPDYNAPDSHFVEGLLGEIVLAGSKTEMRRDMSVEGCDDEWDTIYKRTCSTKKHLGSTGSVDGNLCDNISLKFSDGEWWACNKDHMQSFKDEVQEEDTSQPFKRYDIVCIEKDKETVKGLQEGHGDWSRSMVPALGLRGIVRKIDDNGDVTVECRNHSKWRWNSKLLEAIDTSSTTIEVGDFVLVIDSYKKVKALQDVDHGGWNERMQKTLGSTGTVTAVLSNGRARVNVGQRSWIYNVNALKHIARLDLIPTSNNASWHDMVTSSDPGREFIKKQLHRTSLEELFDSSTSQGPADEKFGVGVQVRVDSDEQKAITLQRNSGGWNSKMKEYLGKTGIIKGTVRNLVVVQFSNGKTWAYNKKLLQPCDVVPEPEKEQNGTFKRYDVVRLMDDKETVKALQDIRCGWKPEMAKVVGMKGIVNRIDKDGDIFVEFINNGDYWFNAALLETIDTTNMKIEASDFVLVIDSYTKVKALQEEYFGGWQEIMRKTLGSTGIVLDILPYERAMVHINGLELTYNIKALRFIASAEEMIHAQG